MKESVDPNRYAWAIGARARSQKLLLALYEFGEQRGYRSGKAIEPKLEADSKVFSGLVGVTFSLWRAAFLADMPTRTWPEAVRDAHQLIQTVLATNTIGFQTEHERQGWSGGYYLSNALLRLRETVRWQVKDGRSSAAELSRLENTSLLGTNPHETWTQFCEEAERLARQLGCKLPL